MSLFNKKQEKKEEATSVVSQANNIGKVTVITGNIVTQGNIRIEGKIIGDIHSKAKVVMGNGSVVEGNIYAQNAEIEGEVKGRLEIADLLTLKSTAVINGDIFTSKIVTDSGAQINGKIMTNGGTNTTTNALPSASEAARKNPMTANGTSYAGKKVETAA